MLSDFIAMVSAITFDELVLVIQEHQYLIAVLTPFLTGEFSVQLFGILSGSGDISLVPAVIATVSMLALDTMIYGTVRLLQQHTPVMHSFKKINLLARCDAFFKKYEERYRRHPTLLLIAVKLMPMTKFTLIFYALYQKMSIMRFIARDTAITVVWITIIFIPGWLTGKEFLTQETGRRISTFIIYFVLVIVVVTLFGEKINQVIMKIMNKVANTLDASRR